MGPIDASAYSYLAIGRRLAAIRTYLGLTQAQLTARIGMAPARWGNYEIGTSRIPIDEAIKIVQLVGVSLDYIYYGNATLLPPRLAHELGRLEQTPILKREKKGKP